MNMDSISGLHDFISVKHLVIEIGVTYSTIACYFLEEKGNNVQEKIINQVFKNQIEVIKFKTMNLSDIIEIVRSKIGDLRGNQISINVIGMNMPTYRKLIEDKLKLRLDERSITHFRVSGIHFLTKEIEYELYNIDKQGNSKFTRYNFNVEYPYLLVDISEKVRITKVHSQSSYEEICQNGFGGTTFLSLISFITNSKVIGECVNILEAVDINNFEPLKFAPFEQCMEEAYLKNKSVDVSESQFLKGLFWIFSTQIGQLVSLNAKSLGVNKIFFLQTMINNDSFNKMLSLSVKHWTQGSVEVNFLRHDGFIGAIGALVELINGTEKSWIENYARSSGSVSDTFLWENISICQLVLQAHSVNLVPCPLLYSQLSYVPETMPLFINDDLRKYLVAIVQGAAKKIIETLIKGKMSASASSLERYRNMIINKLQCSFSNPLAFGGVTHKQLLIMVTNYISHLGVPDVYQELKSEENIAALSHLNGRLQYLDSLKCDEKNTDLMFSVLAGNMFDRGAPDVKDLLENQQFDFRSAKNKIPCRPWLIDNIDEWLQRLQKPQHHKAAIFIDNSGVDIVLGIMPLVLNFLRRGTKVLICSNSSPAVNDVTHSEMLGLIRKISEISPEIHKAVEESKLKAIETGQISPFLDFSRINIDLAQEMFDVDLIFIEGMGRGILTNLNAKFCCDVVNIGVIKDDFIASKLGGKLYSSIFKYESLSNSV